MSEGELSFVRIDKWLWAVRICKTRKIASELCKRHRVLVEGQPVKSSRDVRPEQVVTVKREGIEWQYKVIRCIDKRVGAALVGECKQDITPSEILERLKLIKKDALPRRPKGAGRPTKKERRDLQKVKEI